jgi:hypothetical protein
MKKQKGNNDLIIVSTNKDASLSKSAKKFNTLLKKLEQLKSDRENVKVRLEQNLQDTYKDVMPIYGELCELQADFLLAVIDHFNSTKLSAQKEYYIMSYVDMVKGNLMHGPYQLSEEKRKKLEEATGVDDESDAELDALLDDVFGELEEDEDNEGDFEDFFQYQPLNDTGEGKTKKKTKKQLEKEAAKAQFNQEKDKSFSTMYKSLVKLLHPDGETDEELKLKKTEWMKELTVAYKNKDIQTLLKIELEWMQSDKSLAEKQSEERLAYINELLKEQVREEELKFAMILQDPRYRILYFFAQSSNILYFSAKLIAKSYKEQIGHHTKILQRMQSSKKEANDVFKEIAEEMKYEF